MYPYTVLLSWSILDKSIFDEIKYWMWTEIGEIKKEWDVAEHVPTNKLLFTFKKKEHLVRFILTWGEEGRYGKEG